MAFDYEKMITENLFKIGFNPNELTEEQRDLIIQPSEAPENYYQDGELTASQAFSWWKNKLQNSGLSPQQVQKAIKLNFR